MKKNKSKFAVHQQLIAKKAEIARTNLNRYEQEIIKNRAKDKIYKKILVFAIICILLIVPFLILGNFLYKEHTWKDHIIKGMTRKEFEAVLPYFDRGAGIASYKWTIEDYTVGNNEIETMFEDHYNDDGSDDTLIDFKIKEIQESH